MIYRILILLLLSFNILIGQSVEFVAGVSKADFTVDDHPRFQNFSTADLGYNLYFNITDIVLGIKTLEDITGRITLGLSSSSGEFRSTSGGNAGQSSFYAKTEKKHWILESIR